MTGNKGRFQAVEKLLDERFGLHFPDFRRGALELAVRRGVRNTGAGSAEAYAQRLSSDGSELSMLVSSTTNNLTRMFRNRTQLDILTSHLSPRFPDHVSVWVAGCATGEEPYSLAMALVDRGLDPARLSIVASDISTTALETAREGIYPVDVIAGVPNALRSRFFTVSRGQARIRHTIRDCVSFRNHSVTAIPPVHGVHLVVLRNVLTYLSASGCVRALAGVRVATECGALLAIGNAESLPPKSGFEPVLPAANRVFRRSCPDGSRNLP